MTESARRKWLALALLCAVQFMVALDVSIVNVALPSIQTDLGFSAEDLQRVLSAYALVFGGFLLLGGRLGVATRSSRRARSRASALQRSPPGAEGDVPLPPLGEGGGQDRARRGPRARA